MSDTSSKVAVVTGASRGVGKGIAIALGAAGATVYVTGRTAEEGSSALPGSVSATAQEVTREGGRGIAVVRDHRDDAAVEALFDLELCGHVQRMRGLVLVGGKERLP